MGVKGNTNPNHKTYQPTAGVGGGVMQDRKPDTAGDGGHVDNRSFKDIANQKGYGQVKRSR